YIIPVFIFDDGRADGFFVGRTAGRKTASRRWRGAPARCRYRLLAAAPIPSIIHQKAGLLLVAPHLVGKSAASPEDFGPDGGVENRGHGAGTIGAHEEQNKYKITNMQEYQEKKPRCTSGAFDNVLRG